MKKTASILVFLVFILIGCSSNSLIKEVYKEDVNQALEKLDNAYDEKRELNESEIELLDQFHEKYIVGKFLTKDKSEYEMNDLEKEIVREIEFMRLHTDTSEGLASEENVFESSRKRVTDYLKAKKIPEDLKDQYPTYEISYGIHPQMKEDALEVIEAFDPVINDNKNEVTPNNIAKLNVFLNTYADGEFEIDDKYYLLEDGGKNIVHAFQNLKEDLENGGLSYDTRDHFNEVKELISE
ncbi:hypothetical protein [Psychrobacillus sp.]|uniref:hypothetical protein n=1 Tax=Psychrobacillus sp. TaxID=1871623 RepID=UPI0028BE3EAC|nr:hypothetical protein [Psychrobacillus sp.]